MKKINKNIVAWLYVLFFIVQVFSMLSAFIIQNEFAKFFLPFFRFWDALGTPIFENWLPYSILFIMIYVSDVLASQLKSETDILNRFSNFILLCVNLFLCNRLYDTATFQQKIKFITKNIWSFLGFVLAIIIVLLTGYVLKRAREARNSYTNKSPATNDIIDDEDGISRNNVDFQSNDQDELFMKRYPILYIWNNFKYYLSCKKEINYQKKLEYHEAKADAKIEIIRKKYDQKINLYDPKHKIDIFPKIVSLFNRFLRITPILIVISIDILIIKYFYQKHISGQSFGEVLQYVKDCINNSSSFFNTMQDPALNWLFVSGNALLIIFLAILINYCMYFIIKVILYFICNSMEDSAHIKKFSRHLKTFFFGIVESVIRLLLILPDFLKLLEDILLDIDIDKLVNERFEEFDKQSESTPPEQYNRPSQQTPSNLDEGEE